MIKIPDELVPVLKAIIEQDGEPFLVGGANRDYLMNRIPKDFDFEVFGLESGQLFRILNDFGKVEMVGKSFGVLDLHIGEVKSQFSIPRTEVKSSAGRSGFDFLFDPFMSKENAQKRRDFTIGAIYLDIIKWLQGEMSFVDHFNGIKDIENRILRHTSFMFIDDPLRVLRGMRFGAMGFKMHSETIALSRQLLNMHTELSYDRVRDEFIGWSKNPYPSMGLDILEQTEWIILFPTLAAMISCEQEKEWHPEGDVWTHSVICTQEAADIARRLELGEEDTSVLVLAALLHDCGKPTTTIIDGGRIKSPKHDIEGAEAASKFLTNFKFSNNYIDRITELVVLHMWQVHNKVTERTVRRLLSKLKYNDLKMLLAIIEADHSSRPPLPKGLPVSMKDAQEIAAKVKDQVKPIIMGRHIQTLTSVKQASWFGKILSAVYEQQLDGKFSTEEEGYLILQEELVKNFDAKLGSWNERL